MLEYNEITVGKVIDFEGSPFEVVSNHVFRKQQRKPQNAVKMKSLVTGKVIENSFHQSEKVEEAEIESKNLVFIFVNKGQFTFHEENQPSKRLVIDESMLGPAGKFLKQGMLCKVLIFDDKIIKVLPPIKVELKVIEAPPTIKGASATGGNKVVVVEGGASVNAPLFINEGDTIRINTETGEYTERVS